MRDNHILIYDGEKWILDEKDKVLQNLIDDKSDILSEKFEELLDKLDIHTIKKFQRFLDDKDNSHTIQQIKRDLKIILYNNKNVPEKTRRLINDQ